MFIPAELTYLVSEYLSIRFKIPTNQEILSSGLHAFFCVDKSGSMSGCPIKDSKGALISLIQKFQKVRAPITVYLYSNTMQELSSEQHGYQTMQEESENIRAAGGTLFGPVIDSMQKKIREKKLKNVFAVWLTDGQDNEGIVPLIEKMDLFRLEMEKSGVSIAVHTIGFSPEHDTTLLSKLSQSGTRPGSFQYVPPGGRIPVAVNNVYELAFVDTAWARIITPNTIYKTEIENDEGYLKGLAYISENDLEDCKVEVHTGDKVELFDIDTFKGETRDFRELVLLTTNFISTKIIQVLESYGDKADQILKEMRPLIELMYQRIESLIQESRRFRVFFRKQIQTFFLDTKELLLECFETMKKSSGSQLSNTELANLNNLAHKNSLKRNLEKKIIREFGKNLNDLNECEAKIDDFLKTINKVELELKYSRQLEKYGKCILTNQNWLDSLCIGDCFCLTFQLERPRDLKGDPLQVKIKKINAVVVSCEAFADSVLFETKAGQIIQGSRNYQHGEIPVSASSLIKDFPNEIINGVLPIFINHDHWQVAKLRIKQMIAWDITVDVLGYKPTQLFYFPFALLVKALEDCNNEFTSFQCELIKETCLAVYNDNRQAMSEIIKKHFEKYLEKPSHRLPKHIPNNSIFICQVWAAHTMGDIEKPEIIFPFIFEEEVRRRIDSKKEIPFQDFAIKLLGIDKKVYAEEVKNSLVNGNCEYGKIFQDLKNKGNFSANLNSGEKKKQGTFELTETGDLSKATGRGKTFISRIEKSMSKGGVLHRLLASIQLFGGPAYESFESIGLLTTEQKLCLLLQSYRDHRDTERRVLIKNNKYFNIFIPEIASQVLKEIFLSVATREALNYKALLQSEMKTGADKESVIMFGLTSDLEVAAGCLYGLKQGCPDFCLFYKRLALPNSLLVCHKFKMLTHGEFMGVRLIMDDIKGVKVAQWNPSAKVFYSIWKVHNIQCDQNQWIDACPLKREYIQNKYLRMQGVFVPFSKPNNNVSDKRHWKGKLVVPKGFNPKSYKKKPKK